MSESIITRRGSGGYAKVTFDVPCTKLNKVNVSMLSLERCKLAATTIGNYALFGGGHDGSDIYSEGYYYSVVDAYNSSISRTTPTSLSRARAFFTATSIGNYALFGGGSDSSITELPTVDAYNSSLVRSTQTSLSVGRDCLASTTVGDYALFGGGKIAGHNTDCYSTVDAYNTSLTRTTPTTLSTARCDLAAAAVGDYALFGGGINKTNYLSVVDAYNTSLTRTTPANLLMARCYLKSSCVGNYAIFGCGRAGANAFSSNVEAYNNNLTRSSLSSFRNTREAYSSTTLGDYALFSGGIYSNTTGGSTVVERYKNVELYDKNTVRNSISVPDISLGRYDLDAAAVGDYALFGGGKYDSYATNCVDAFTFETKKIQIYPMSKYKFNDMSSETTSQTLQEIELTTPITGYIKVKNTTVN